MKIAFALLLAFSSAVHAAQPLLHVTGSAPTTRVDNSTLASAQIAGYELSFSLNGGTPAVVQSSGSTLVYDYTGSAFGTYTISVRTIDTAGLKSAPITVNFIATPPPAPPANIGAIDTLAQCQKKLTLAAGFSQITQNLLTACQTKLNNAGIH